MPPISPVNVHTFAHALDIDLNRGICWACLGIVAMAVDRGDQKEISREVRRMTPDLWADGLSDYALAAVRRACERGVPGADEALADLERHGGRGMVARAIVLDLAKRLSRRTRTEMRLEGLARHRLGAAPPELN